MRKAFFERISPVLFWGAMALIVYMPLHVLIVQSASLLTGGLEVWKAAKDVILFLSLPILIYAAFKRGLIQDKTFRTFVVLGGVYALFHGLFLVFDRGNHTYSALVGSVYNTRLLGFMLLGYLVGAAANGKKYLKYLLTLSIAIAFIVALFGIMQYFLPSDLLEHVGYSTERGVKALFFIDDKPNLPRVMSTLKDPNSFGAYLILPSLLVGIAIFKSEANKQFFVKPLRRELLIILLTVLIVALLLTFSRGAFIGLIIAALALLCIVEGKRLAVKLKKWRTWIVILFLVLSAGLFAAKDTYTVKNVIFHSDESTVEADPNEKRLSFTKEAATDIAERPFGHGPGTAGLVSINNPQGGFLTENYYLQIGYEIGWGGLAVFVGLVALSAVNLYKISRKPKEGKYVGAVLFSGLMAYSFYSLLIHLWSNESVALEWWLLAGVVIGAYAPRFEAKKVSGGKVLIGLIFLIYSGLLIWSIQTRNPRTIALPQEVNLHKNREGESTFSFSAAGDFGANSNSRRVFDLIAASETDFTLGLGDFAYGDVDNSQEWCDFAEKSFPEEYPFLLVVGNHEIGSSNGDKAHINELARCFPTERIKVKVSGEYPRLYSFDYKNLARFIQADPALNYDGINREYQKGSPEYNRLKSWVSEARAKKIPWVIVSMHKNCITFGDKSCDIGEPLINMLIGLKVDLILQGHEHAYLRSKPLALSGTCKQVLPDQFNERCVGSSGTTIVISGAGGYEHRELNHSRANKGYFESWSDHDSGTSFFQVFEEKIQGLFLSIEGKALDTFTISKTR